MLQQHPVLGDCRECCKKQEMLDKFSRLVHLLKKKTQREDQSRFKSSMISQLDSITHTHNHIHPTFTLVAVVSNASFRNLYSSFKNLQARACQPTLPFLNQPSIIQYTQDKQPPSAHSPTPLHSPHSQLHQLQPKGSGCRPSMESQYRFLENIQIKSSPKFLLKKIFSLTHQNQILAQKLKLFQQDLQQNMRRQEREIAKKRQSLQGLVEQLSQKNEVIDELKETIKSLEGKLGAKDNVVLHRMLQEDGQSLRHTILKLQNTNQKLNNQIFKVRGQKALIEKQNKELGKSIQSLKCDIMRLKESMFQSEHQAEQNRAQKRELQIVRQKVATKWERAKRMEKRCNEVNRGKDSISTHPDQLTISKSERKVETTLFSVQRNEEDRVGDLENKLEAVFDFLFHLANKDYHLRSLQLFDEEEKELMLTHQLKFIASMKANDLRPIDTIPKRCIEQHTDFIQLGDSLFQAFQDNPSEPKPTLQLKSQLKPPTLDGAGQNDKGSSLKLMQFEIERKQFIEKISEVKERELHTRCVILQLIKSLDLRAMKKDTEGILSLICDLFEYSEEERTAMLQPKTRKFFGIL